MPKQKVFSLLFNANPLYQRCLDLVPREEVDFEIITDQYLGNQSLNSRAASDGERVYHLKNHPDWWYLDADTYVYKWPDFKMEPGCPYIYNQNGNWDNSIILGNGCKWFFDYMFERFDPSRQIIWYLEIFKELEDKIKPIPTGYFNHMAFNGMHDFAIQTGKRIGGKGFSAQYTNGLWDLQIDKFQTVI